MDPFREAIAGVMMGDFEVGYLATNVDIVWDHGGGALWWSKWINAREMVQWMITRTDEGSPLPDYDDGIDFFGAALREFESGWVSYPDDRGTEPLDRRDVYEYRLNWLTGAAREAAWADFGFDETTRI